jgi:hypothetical protein
MKSRLTKCGLSQTGGMHSEGSSCPEFEAAYFKSRYGSDNLHQLYDRHQDWAIGHFVLPNKREQVFRVLRSLPHLKCVNAPEMMAPGRSAVSLRLLRENLAQYTTEKCRSLRWNRHYQQALALVRRDVLTLLGRKTLKPMAIRDVAASESLRRNIDKNAGYMAFETGKRSKGENMDEAVEWCLSNLERIAREGKYDRALVMSHRSSNSKPVDGDYWKWRCRIILMQDLKAQLCDGRFLIPFTTLFRNIEWGEGGMTDSQVEIWVQVMRVHYDAHYSSDYSKFDTSQAAWLLEDAFDQVIRPCFGELSELDEALFEAMKYSYIHKDIHTFDGVIHTDSCQVSGSLATYAINTVINQVIDLTAILMQGCNPDNFRSLKCGDDNLTYYKSTEPWNAEKHCALIKKYFGIGTTMAKDDWADSSVDPKFLSREWSLNGKKRPLREVLFNLVYPERFRCYSPEQTGVSVRRATALTFLCSCLEQDATMREYFDIEKVYLEAGVNHSHKQMDIYKAVANLGSGFKTSWLNWFLDQQNVSF